MTSAAHRQQLATAHGIEDAWPVVCEPFVQWVLEDKFVNGRPAWEKVGVQFTDDVTPYEEMKIKLLNGSHLALTYLGFLQGYRFVHQTMHDPLLRRYVRAFMDLDVSPQLAAVPGIDLTQYKDSLIERFSNQAIADQLERVCSDGSSKFPKFIVPTINHLIEAGQPLERLGAVPRGRRRKRRALPDCRSARRALPDAGGRSATPERAAAGRGGDLRHGTGRFHCFCRRLRALYRQPAHPWRQRHPANPVA
jgi:mannitol-1-phosphate/altronate dehydrogenase